MLSEIQTKQFKVLIDSVRSVQRYFLFHGILRVHRVLQQSAVPTTILFGLVGVHMSGKVRKLKKNLKLKKVGRTQIQFQEERYKKKPSFFFFKKERN